MEDGGGGFDGGASSAIPWWLRPGHLLTSRSTWLSWALAVSHAAFSPSSATYIKVYLLENGACLAKKKTKVTKKTCDPLYQQALLFDEGPQGKELQVRVGGRSWNFSPL